MILYLYGEEPYLVATKLYLLKKGNDFLETEDIEEALQFSSSYGFFGNRVAHYTKPDPNEADFEKIKKSNLSKNPNTLVITGTLRKRSKFYSWLEKNGQIIACDRLDENKAVEFCAKSLKKLGVEITRKAAVAFMEQSGYYLGEVSLFYIQNELKKLSLISNQITEKEVAMLPKNSYVNQWKLVTDLDKKPEVFLSRTIQLAEEKGAISLLSIFLRAFRIAYKVKLLGEFNPGEIGITQYQYRNLKWLERLTSGQISDVIMILTDGIAAQKGQAINQEAAMVLTLSRVILTVHGDR